MEFVNREFYNPTKDNFSIIISDKEFAGAINSFNATAELTGFDEQVTDELKDDKNRNKLIAEIENLADTFANNGIEPKTGIRMSMTDAFNKMSALKDYVSKDYGPTAANIIVRQIVTRTIEKIPEEGTVYQFFTKKINVKTNEEIMLPVIGSTANESLDIAPGTEPHLISVSQDASMIAKCGLSAIGVSLPHDTIRRSKYNIYNLYTTEAKNALSRWKDVKAVRTAFNGGIVVFDNLEPQNSVLGKTTGRSFKTSVENGTFTLKDFYSMFLYGIQSGIYCDTVMLSTIGWLVFINDDIMKKFVESSGGVIFRGPQGQIGADLDPYRAMMGGTRPENNKIIPDIPRELMNVNFRFIVTPHVPFYTEGQLILKYAALGSSNKTYYMKDGHPVKCGKDPMTNIIMLDSGKGMLHLEEESVRTTEENDVLRENTKIYYKERYTFEPLYKGQGILVAKNISVTDDVLDVRSFVTVSLTEAQKALGTTAD